jgi:hypothetical protein
MSYAGREGPRIADGFAKTGSISLRSNSYPRARIRDGVPVSREGNVEIVVADERAVLAMKIRARRPVRDGKDIKGADVQGR